MSPYSIFVFLAQHSLGLTIAVITMVLVFVIMRANFSRPESPASYPYKSFKSSSYVANESNQALNQEPNQKVNQTLNQAPNHEAAANPNQANPNQANHTETFKRIKAANHINDIERMVEYVEAPNSRKKHLKKAMQLFKSSKVFYSHKAPANRAPIEERNCKKQEIQMQRNKNQNKKKQIASATQHISALRNEVDLNMTCYPQYLDGYCALSENEKLFLLHIKNNNLSAIKKMRISNINFGECRVLRECVLSDRLEILRYLKETYLDLLDLNGESGYLLRWSSRKGLYAIVNYLLYQQKYQEIDICFFQFQALEWSIIYKHKKIAKLLQKFYCDWKLNTKWNVLQQQDSNANASHLQNTALELDEFDIFNLPSIYQQIIEIIINCDENCGATAESIEILDKYYENGCDLSFENNMAWMVAADCANIGILQFLCKRVGISPVCKGNYLLRTSLELNSIQLLQFAKEIINLQSWKQNVEPNIYQFQQLCNNNKKLLEELQNYPKQKKNKRALPQTPIPWPYENTKEKYGILTRSKRKELVKKGILQEM